MLDAHRKRPNDKEEKQMQRKKRLRLHNTAAAIVYLLVNS
jgi:hypothetical protein